MNNNIENTNNYNTPNITEFDEVFDLNDLDLDDFQVVRREYFAHLRDPSCTFNNCKFQVNAACLAKFPNTEYAQVLVNKESKILALRPCPEGAKDSFQWCTTTGTKRKPKPITCKLFFAKIVDLMGWNPNHRYKMLGKIIHSNGEYLLVFDLTATEVYQRTIVDGEKPKTSRVPVFPAEWQDQFGLPYSEHKKAMEISVVDGYAVYSIRETEPTEKNVSLEASNTPGSEPVALPESLSVANNNLNYNNSPYNTPIGDDNGANPSVVSRDALFTVGQGTQN